MTSKRVWLSVAALCLGAGCATTGDAQKKAAAASAATAAQAPTRSSTDAKFKEAVADFKKGKVEDAQAGFEAVVEQEPDNLNARFNLGVIAERRGNLSKAQGLYEGVLAENPDHAPAILNLGKLYRLQGKYDRAVALYEAALQRPGRDFDVALLNNLSVAYRLQKDYAKAEATARRVLARSKDNAEAYKNLALVYYEQGNYRLAEFISGNARKLDDKDPGVYNNLGMIYLKMDERARALAQFQKAVKLSDAFAPGHMNIGAMALQYRDYETAEKSFAKALELEPNSVEARLRFAYALDGQKGRDPKKGLAAAAEFEKVLAVRPDEADAICGAGWAYSVDKSGWERAVRYLDRCKTQPSLADVDRQAIDAKLQSLAVMIKNGKSQPAEQKREAPKGKGGTKMLDKASEQEAASEPQADATPAEAPVADPATAVPEGATAD